MALKKKMNIYLKLSLFSLSHDTGQVRFKVKCLKEYLENGHLYL